MSELSTSLLTGVWVQAPPSSRVFMVPQTPAESFSFCTKHNRQSHLLHTQRPAAAFPMHCAQGLLTAKCMRRPWAQCTCCPGSSRSRSLPRPCPDFHGSERHCSSLCLSHPGCRTEMKKCLKQSTDDGAESCGSPVTGGESRYRCWATPWSALIPTWGAEGMGSPGVSVMSPHAGLSPREKSQDPQGFDTGLQPNCSPCPPNAAAYPRGV